MVKPIKNGYEDKEGLPGYEKRDIQHHKILYHTKSLAMRE